eukprot:CAMPEP_0179846666 /NCGR_PEP_ID=MMETSP0982-20121206/5671_1 /TAXON_ID=483367 /ORGANISM="non described non described, Strain CCMP 2436" /LENGTH=1253 /DNA_ID=CAMNT_0021731799 /DNA_START=17 /DNA_END=3778 /DNA_ORIENTATION=-
MQTLQRPVGSAIAQSGLVGNEARLGLASEPREPPAALGHSASEDESPTARSTRNAQPRATATGLFPRPLDWQPPPAQEQYSSPTAISACQSDDQHSERTGPPPKLDTLQAERESPSKRTAHLGVKWLAPSAYDTERRLPAEMLIADLPAAGAEEWASDLVGLTQVRTAGEEISALERKVERELLRASARAREKAEAEAAGGVVQRLSPPHARGAVHSRSPTKGRAAQVHALSIAAGASDGPMPPQRAIELSVSRAEVAVVERALKELVAQVATLSPAHASLLERLCGAQAIASKLFEGAAADLALALARREVQRSERAAADGRAIAAVAVKTEALEAQLAKLLTPVLGEEGRELRSEKELARELASQRSAAGIVAIELGQFKMRAEAEAELHANARVRIGENEREASRQREAHEGDIARLARSEARVEQLALANSQLDARANSLAAGEGEKMTELRRALDASALQRASLAGERDFLRSDLNTRTAERDTLRELKTKMDSELAGCRFKQAKLVADLSAAQQEAEENTLTADRLVEQVEAHKEHQAELRALFDDEQGRRKVLEKEAQTLRHLGQTVVAREWELRVLASGVSDADTAFVQMRAQAAEMRARSEGLRVEMARQRAELVAEREKSEKETERADEAEEKLAQLSETHARFVEKMQRLEARAVKLEEEAAAATFAASSALKGASVAEAEAAGLKRAVSLLEEKLAEQGTALQQQGASSELTAFRASTLFHQLEGDKKSGTVQLATLGRSLAEADRSGERAARELAELQEQLVELRLARLLATPAPAASAAGASRGAAGTAPPGIVPGGDGGSRGGSRGGGGGETREMRVERLAELEARLEAAEQRAGHAEAQLAEALYARAQAGGGSGGGADESREESREEARISHTQTASQTASPARHTSSAERALLGVGDASAPRARRGSQQPLSSASPPRAASPDLTSPRAPPAATEPVQQQEQQQLAQQQQQQAQPQQQQAQQLQATQARLRGAALTAARALGELKALHQYVQALALQLRQTVKGLMAWDVASALLDKNGHYALVDKLNSIRSFQQWSWTQRTPVFAVDGDALVIVLPMHGNRPQRQLTATERYLAKHTHLRPLPLTRMPDAPQSQARLGKKLRHAAYVVAAAASPLQRLPRLSINRTEVREAPNRASERGQEPRRAAEQPASAESPQGGLRTRSIQLSANPSSPAFLPRIGSFATEGEQLKFEPLPGASGPPSPTTLGRSTLVLASASPTPAASPLRSRSQPGAG